MIAQYQLATWPWARFQLPRKYGEIAAMQEPPPIVEFEINRFLRGFFCLMVIRYRTHCMALPRRVKSMRIILNCELTRKITTPSMLCCCHKSAGIK
jgi:hypothetical protein